MISRPRATVRRATGLVLLGAAAHLAGCGSRDRLLFPDPGGPGGNGPTTTIDRPLADTSVSAADGVFSVTGFTVDGDGLDTVYFETEGGITSFQPFIGGGDSLRFGLPLTVTGLAGDTITVRVFGTDRDGTRGDTAIRRIAVE